MHENLRQTPGNCGHSWQAGSALEEVRHAWEALAYVEKDPVRAGLVGTRWAVTIRGAGESGGGARRG
jgi:hypothetical protein